MAARPNGSTVVTDAAAGYFGGPLDAGTLVPLAAARIGRISLEDWLRSA